MVNINLIIPARHRLRRLLKRLHPRHMSLIISFVLIIAVLLIYWTGSMSIPYVSNDFSYSANLQTTLNTYDTASDRFSGDQYLQSTFSMQQIGRGATTTDIRTTTHVNPVANTNDGKQTIIRQYVVNSDNGKLLQHGDHQQAVGYLFAPRSIAKGAPFITWHPLYDAPATMRFVSEDVLYGLRVYGYVAQYANDGFVKVTGDAPAGQGRESKTDLKLWIEPTTGWLVKYQEDTTDYFYDLATNKQINPISHTSSSFTEDSIHQHADYARQLKYRLDFGLQIVPSVLMLSLLILVFFFFVRLFKVRNLPVEVTATSILAIGLANLVGWLLHIKPLIVLVPGNIALNPMASICFMVVAIGMLLLCYGRTRRLAAFCGMFVIAIAALAILHIANLISFNIDSFLFHKTVVDLSVNTPDNLSLFGAGALIILGSSLIKIAHATIGTSLYMAKILAGIAVTLGTFGLIAKLLLLDEVFVVPSVASLSVGGSVLCLLSGVGLMQILLYYYLQDFTTDGIHRHKQTLLGAFLKPALITIPIIAIGVLAQSQQIITKQQLRTDFDQQISNLQSAITNKLDIYANTLVGAKALFAASISVERDEWHEYFAAVDVAHNFPGVQGVGFIRTLSPAQAADMIRQSTIFPTNIRNTYTTLAFMEPSIEVNNKLIGYDVSTDQLRSAAMQAAASSGKPTVSGKISLLQESNQNTSDGFAIFLPIYRNGTPTSTEAERQQALQGYVYAPFDSKAFFKDAITNQKAAINFNVYDGYDISSSALLFAQTAYNVDKADPAAKLTKTTTVYADNRPWTVTYTAGTDFTRSSNNDERIPSLILIGGGGVYLVSMLTFLTVTELRRQAALAAAKSAAASMQSTDHQKHT